jgi:hypothetical protein
VTTVLSVKRCLCIAVLPVLLTSCNREPPAYESHYVPPASTSTVTPTVQSLPTVDSPPLQASFVDNFDRPDTKLGLGNGWEMLGSPNASSRTLPPATDGFIKDGQYTYAGTSPVYATRQFRGVVHSVGGEGRFRKTGDGFIQTGLAMAITATDQKDTNMLVLGITRSSWNLRARRDVTYSQIAQGVFPQMLKIDRDYRFELQTTDNSVTVTAPGIDQVINNVQTADLLGNRAFWQESPIRTPVDQVFDFTTVWATEKNQPLIPVPSP